MAEKLRAFEIWLVEREAWVVAWGAIQNDRLEGLYTEPAFAGQGIGARLLRRLEELLQARGVTAVHAEASPNALGFYLRRGYAAAGDPSDEGGRRIVKRVARE